MVGEGKFLALVESEETPEQAAAGVPTGRVALPEEIADAVVWLLRPESRNITGLALPIEGGGLALP